MHPLSAFEANHTPEAMMGIEQRKATKFSTAVMLLASPMAVEESAREERQWASGCGERSWRCRFLCCNVNVTHFTLRRGQSVENSCRS